MTQPLHLSDRDRALLKLLASTPATAALIRKASVTFPGEPFRDERRTRERLQTLSQAGLVQHATVAANGGGTLQYYWLTNAGCVVLGRSRTPRLEPIPLSRFAHSLAVAEVIVHSLVAAQVARAAVLQVHGDGQLALKLGEQRLEPDAHFMLYYGGRTFNVLFEIDNATEPLDSSCTQSIRSKITAYEAYQDWVLRLWRDGPRTSPRPLFRVVFSTKRRARANHMLWLASELARNPDRRLIYAATQDEFLGEPNALTMPILNDHRGRWQALVDLHPTAAPHRGPLRLSPPTERGFLR